MSDQNNGLRFDVYERVHLPDDVAAIDELEEIELVPRIQVIDQGEQAVLKGQLLLSGVYRSQNAIAGPLTLEHWIPVEISLPMNRVSRLDDISIEIDNFDVDLISARTLNITGVLSLRGIAVDPVEEQSGQLWEEEPFTATHEREADSMQQAEAFAQDGQSYGTDAFGDRLQGEYAAIAPNWEQGQQDVEQREYASQSHQAVQDEQSYIADASAIQSTDEDPREIAIDSQQAGGDSWLQWSALAETGQKAQISEQAQPEQEEQATLAQPWIAEPQYTAAGEQEGGRPEEEAAPQAAQSESVSESGAQSGAEEAALADAAGESRIEQKLEPPIEITFGQESEQAQAERKQQEVQIAFSAGGEERQGDVGFGALLQSSRREQALREAAEQLDQEQQQAEIDSRTTAIEEEIEWKKLFLSKAQDNEFRKIRMCIVQKEETLEQIAVRYSLNPRDILNHNRLHESAVEEGQLLYIP